jgi:hypothetical protein
MSDTILYQSVLQKLGQLSPSNLSQLDAFLSVLIGHNGSQKTEKITAEDNKSAVDWLEELAKTDSFSDIADPVEWQRSIREERKLPFR